jgi:hypothetical protein
MPKFVIEREMPGLGSLTTEDLRGASQTSCGVLREMGPQIQWLESYVTDDKLTASTSRRTRRRCGSMRSEADFRPTRWRRCGG